MTKRRLGFPLEEITDLDGLLEVGSHSPEIALSLFFSSRSEGEQWGAEKQNGTFMLSLDKAYELGRRCNALRNGKALRRA